MVVRPANNWHFLQTKDWRRRQFFGHRNIFQAKHLAFSSIPLFIDTGPNKFGALRPYVWRLNCFCRNSQTDREVWMLDKWLEFSVYAFLGNNLKYVLVIFLLVVIAPQLISNCCRDLFATLLWGNEEENWPPIGRLRVQFCQLVPPLFHPTTTIPRICHLHPKACESR